MRKLLLLALVIPVSASLLSAAAAAPRAGRVTLRTSAPVAAIAADGRRADLIASNRPGVLLWGPVRHRVVTFRSVLQGDCNCVMSGVALAGSRVGWLETAVGMTATETLVGTATLARPKPVEVASASGSAFGEYGDAALAPIGDGGLLVFTLERRCAAEGEDWPRCPAGRKPGDVIAATIWRVPGNERCPVDAVVRRCARVAKAEGELTVLAVDAGRIVARTDQGVRLLTARGGRLRDFPVAGVRAGALSGNRLALRVDGGFSIYDISSGELVFREEGGHRLEDLERGILVTAAAKTVWLRRPEDGRVATMRTRGIAHARLEPSGLFVAAGRRVTFTPMARVRRLFD